MGKPTGQASLTEEVERDGRMLGLGRLGKLGTTSRKFAVVVFLLLATIIPFIAPSVYLLHVLILAHIFVIYAASWDILTGYTGQLNLGHAMFFGLSAYVVAITNTMLKTPLFLSVLMGITSALVLSLTVGLPCLRLRGPYLAITTFSFSWVLFLLASSAMIWLSGGEEGVRGVKTFVIGSIPNYYLSLILMIISVYILYRIANSETGLILKAIKEDEDAAMACGIDTTRYKLLAFVLSGTFAGIAGAFYAQYMRIVTVDVVALELSASAIAFSLVGGIGTIIGPAMGAYILTILFEGFAWLADYRVFIYNLIIVSFVLFLPGGLMSLRDLLKRKEEVEKVKEEVGRT